MRKDLKSQPIQNNRSFRIKLLNLTIFALMILCQVVKYYGWTDGIDAVEFVKWCIELLVLLL